MVSHTVEVKMDGNLIRFYSSLTIIYKLQIYLLFLYSFVYKPLITANEETIHESKSQCLRLAMMQCSSLSMVINEHGKILKTKMGFYCQRDSTKAWSG